MHFSAGQVGVLIDESIKTIGKLRMQDLACCIKDMVNYEKCHTFYFFNNNKPSIILSRLIGELKTELGENRVRTVLVQNSAKKQKPINGNFDESVCKFINYKYLKYEEHALVVSCLPYLSNFLLVGADALLAKIMFFADASELPYSIVN